MPCKKHTPERLFPTRKDCKTQEQQISLFLKFIMTDNNDVVCRECGMTGHYIRSRRGGIRWRSWWSKQEHEDRILDAVATWHRLDLEAPKFLFNLLPVPGMPPEVEHGPFCDSCKQVSRVKQVMEGVFLCPACEEVLDEAMPRDGVDFTPGPGRTEENELPF